MLPLKKSTWMILASSVAAGGLLVANRPRLMSQDYPVKFGTPILDFGNLKWGGSITREFQFRNVSSRDVVVERVDADCGCTDAGVASNLIPAGQPGILKVTFSPNGFDGPVTRSIALRVKGYLSETRVQLVAKVSPSLRFAPDVDRRRKADKRDEAVPVG